MLLGLLYRIIGDFFSYIGDIGGTTMAGLRLDGRYGCDRGDWGYT